MNMLGQNYGACCENMKDALTKQIDHPMFHEDNGVLRLTIGYVDIADGGRALYQRAIIFCPFCGTQIQDKDSIKS